MQREIPSTDDVSISTMFRCLPVRSCLFTVGPFVLAIAQLANSAFNGLSVTYAAAFAAVMLGFSVLITRYHLVKFRLRQLEAAVEC